MEAIPQATTNPLFLNIISNAFDFGFIAFGVIYFIFTLIVLRQVNLMAATIKTEGGRVLKALAVLYCGFSLGVIVLMIGLF